MYGYEAKRITEYELKFYQVTKDGVNIGKILFVDRKNGFSEIHYLIPDFDKLSTEERLCLRALVEEEW